MIKKSFITTITILFILISLLAEMQIEVVDANPYIDDYVYNDILPSTGTQPPKVTIHSPQNSSLHQKNVTLNFDVNIPNLGDNKSINYIENVYYVASWTPNETLVTGEFFVNKTFFSIDLNDMPDGNLSIIVYAVGLGAYRTGISYSGYTATIYIDRFRMTGFSTVSFVKDSLPPVISIVSPQNSTYTTSDVRLDFAVSESVSELLYCLDGKENQTLVGNLTFTDLAKGMHNVTMYATDLAGNAMASETLFFTIVEPFPTLLVALFVTMGVVVVIVVSLLLYRRHRKSSKSNR
jgi:hypothetical protein